MYQARFAAGGRSGRLILLGRTVAEIAFVGGTYLFEAFWLHDDASGPQWAINSGIELAASIDRVSPPNTYSLKRLWL